jgi:ArsR family transcriptional regulator
MGRTSDSVKASPELQEVELVENLEKVYRLRAGICRALGHPVRLAILDLLVGGEKSNAELLATLGVSKVNLSQHLAVMKNAGLVETRQHGREASHRLAFDEIETACLSISRVLARKLDQETRLAASLNAPRGRSAAKPASTEE